MHLHLFSDHGGVICLLKKMDRNFEKNILFLEKGTFNLSNYLYIYILADIRLLNKLTRYFCKG